MRFVQVNDDASLRIQYPSEKQSVDVHWLGIEIVSSADAQQWLGDRLIDTSEITLRLDRRRLDDQGKLRAYFFVDEALLNAELIQHGLATDATHPSDFASIARRIRNASSQTQ